MNPMNATFHFDFTYQIINHWSGRI